MQKRRQQVRSQARRVATRKTPTHLRWQAYTAQQRFEPGVGTQRVVEGAAPSRPTARGMARPGLLAHVLVSKYAHHLPLYQQSEIYARAGMELERTTLADWVGGASSLLEPLVESLRRHVMAAGKLHADHTPVLAPGHG